MLVLANGKREKLFNWSKAGIAVRAVSAWTVSISAPKVISHGLH